MRTRSRKSKLPAPDLTAFGNWLSDQHGVQPLPPGGCLGGYRLTVRGRARLPPSLGRRRLGGSLALPTPARRVPRPPPGDRPPLQRGGFVLRTGASPARRQPAAEDDGRPVARDLAR